MRKTTIFTLTLLSLAILPAMAQIQTGALGQVWTDFQSYSTDLQNYLQYNLSDNLKPVEVQSQNALSNARGELNIPNPVIAGQRVRDNLILYSSNSDSRAGRFENNSAVRGNLVSNELNRVITRGVAVGILGEKGQIRTKSKLENTERSLQDIAGSNDADNQINSFKNKLESTGIDTAAKQVISIADNLLGQGLLALLTTNQETIKIQQEQSKIVAETFAQTLQNNQSLQYSNLNLANISQQAEETNRARRVETSTEAARLLRATSQLDLFGRKLNN
ncbi:hypothetical protein GNF10_06860 [Nostoc sp. UCD121]|uniref:hypothetical protein n=1 Tax=unclassified Nostoc TaxID=2593658 RepID=UPI001629B84E|nr:MULTISPECIES: hypothetical protein [unclassified Nostoc]MBC1220176.1 hypothetical protein [Nostoc sp. UCD120]MBC1275714.1 hypothetical protein [Nostoc sp. UCD121]MBC1295363.1 hypothetical protein [Nostoc sp. UCD122]